ncbi:hypothetical protein J6590_099320, partial [Homalodisca vitripennis]
MLVFPRAVPIVQDFTSGQSWYWYPPGPYKQHLLRDSQGAGIRKGRDYSEGAEWGASKYQG